MRGTLRAGAVVARAVFYKTGLDTPVPRDPPNEDEFISIPQPKHTLLLWGATNVADVNE